MQQDFLVGKLCAQSWIFKSTLLVGQLPCRLRERPTTLDCTSLFSPFSTKWVAGVIFMGSITSHFLSSLPLVQECTPLSPIPSYQASRSGNPVSGTFNTTILPSPVNKQFKLRELVVSGRRQRHYPRTYEIETYFMQHVSLDMWHGFCNCARRLLRTV